MLIEEDKKIGDHKSVDAAIRSAKKAARPSKIGVPEKGQVNRKKKPKQRLSKIRGAFDQDFDQRASGREGLRAKRELLTNKKK